MYRNTQELIALLKNTGLWAQKKLGQNFLVNPAVLGQIIAAGAVSKEDFVVEIGPGLGILTEALAQKAGKVRTIEYDAKLIPYLREFLRTYPNVELIQEDALRVALPAEPFKLIANIPYYITSPLLNHFLGGGARPDDAGTNNAARRPSLIVLLVQKEVAEKICASAGDHSILSLEVQIFGKPEIVSNVGKNSFFPPPKVDSAIIKIVTYEKPLIENTKTFFRIIKAAFGQKRKTLLNSFQNNLMLEKEAVLKMLAQAQIEPTRRPQTLSIEEWGELVGTYDSMPGLQKITYC